MAVQTIEVASIGEVPDDCDWSTGGLGVSDSEMSYSLNDAQHAFSNKWIRQQVSSHILVDAKVREQYTHERHDGS